jgi:hypothetical protein
MLARDSIIYFIVIFGPCVLALGIIGANLGCLSLLSMPYNKYICKY